MHTPLTERLLERDGRIGLVDRMRLVTHGTLARLSSRRGRRGPTPTEADVARVANAMDAPGGAVARAARRACEEASPPWLAHHCERTWRWAAAFGELSGVSYDRELLFAAALLHDLGLTTAHPPEGDACFSIASARAADAIALAAGVDARRRRRMVDAIVLHLEMRVALAAGAEAHLLQAGAACDVLGARLPELPVPLVLDVLARYPRGTFGEALASRMTEIAHDAPATRVGFYCRSFDFADRVRRTRFPEARS